MRPNVAWLLIGAFAASSGLLIGCGGGASARMAERWIPVAQALPNIHHFAPFAVTNGNTVTLFDPRELRSVTISLGVENPRVAAFGADGNLYIANAPSDRHRGGFVSVYEKGSATPRTISMGVDVPQAMAFDRGGTLFVANVPASSRSSDDCTGGCVAVFARGAGSPRRLIVKGVHGPTALAVDSHQFLYVANSPYGGAPSVAVFAPGRASPLYEITGGLDAPRALALDASRRLYVANRNSVTVYAFGQPSPLRTIVKGISAPSALTFDASGKLYVANSNANSVTVYLPRTGKYAGSITARLQHPTGLGFDASGKLYVANQFGRTGTGTVTMYDPQYRGTISTGVSFPVALNFALSSAALPPPTSPSPSPTGSATPIPLGAWTSAPALPDQLNELAAAGDGANGTLYAVGGNRRAGGYSNALYALDPSTSSAWVTKTGYPGLARCCLAASVIGGTLYALGGDTGYNRSTGALDAYEPATDTWISKAPMPTPRIYLGVGAVDGILYAVGGRNGTPVVFNTLEAYNPKTNAWTAKAPMPTARFALGVGVIKGILYAAGGYSATNVPLNVLEAYDPKRNAWSTKAPMPAVRTSFGAAVVNDILYVVSGDGDTPGFNTSVDAYNPVTNRWTTGLSAIPVSRDAFAAGVLDGIVYAIGGNANGLIVGSVSALNPHVKSTPVPPTPSPSPQPDYRILYSFAGGQGDGANPRAPVLFLNGALFGTTFAGGRSACSGGCGTVFRVTTSGKERVLHAFAGSGDGALPAAGLTPVAGSLYGTASRGGPHSPYGYEYGCAGTAFDLSRDGTTYRTVYYFCNRSDGYEPEAALLHAGGTLYGVTTQGPGKRTCRQGGCGTIFSLSAAGTENVLYRFPHLTDGAGPQSAGLVEDGDGTFYGATNFGGRFDNGNGWSSHTFGTVYAFSRGRETVLHSFGSRADGSGPDGTLLDVSGTLYGVTNSGGTHQRGVAFGIHTNGSGYEILHDFGSAGDGTTPIGALIFAGGALFGVTEGGGARGCGTIFRLDPSTHAERVLHSFCSTASDGNLPLAGLTYAGGTLYGTTSGGGANALGTVFALKL